MLCAVCALLTVGFAEKGAGRGAGAPVDTSKLKAALLERREKRQQMLAAEDGTGTEEAEVSYGESTPVQHNLTTLVPPSVC
jgi:hypothetical protein